MRQYVQNINQQEKQTAQTVSTMQEHMETIRKNPAKTLGFKKKNSKEMAAVLETIERLVELRSQDISADGIPAAMEEQRALYEKAIEKCNTYLNKNKKPRTGAGKTRRQQVELILAQCQEELQEYESNAISESAQRLAQMGVKATWGDAVRMAGEVAVKRKETEADVFGKNFEAHLENMDNRERYRLMKYIISDNREKLAQNYPWYQTMQREQEALTPEQLQKIAINYYRKNPQKFRKVDDNGNLIEKDYAFPEIENLDTDEQQRMEEAPQTVTADTARVRVLGDAMSKVVNVSYTDDTDSPVQLFFKKENFRQYRNYVVEEVAQLYGGNLSEAQIRRLDTIFEENLQEQTIFQVLADEAETFGALGDGNVNISKEDIEELGGKNEIVNGMFKDLVFANAGISLENDISKRNVATSIVAKMLGVPDLVAKSRMAKLTLPGEEEQHGIVMEEAKGQQGNLVMKFVRADDEEFFRQLQNLQFLDTICGQIDRHERNYFIDITGQSAKLMGIDNDLSFGTLNFEAYTRHMNHFNPTYQKNKRDKDAKKDYDFGRLDKEFVLRIMNLTGTELDFFLGKYLNKNELKAAKNRLQGLQDILRGYVGADEAGNLREDSEVFTQGIYKSEYKDQFESVKNRPRYNR